MTGHGAKFGRKKEEAIVALLTQRNLEEAARSIGIDPKTLLRWMKEPEFDAAYREARRMAYGQSIGRLQQAASAASSTLLKIMIDPNSPPSCRLRAADSVLSHAAKAIEIEDIEARLSELERASEASKQMNKA
jgi:transposase-like protein